MLANTSSVFGVDTFAGGSGQFASPFLSEFRKQSSHLHIHLSCFGNEECVCGTLVLLQILLSKAVINICFIKLNPPKLDNTIL